MSNFSGFSRRCVCSLSADADRSRPWARQRQSPRKRSADCLCPGDAFLVPGAAFYPAPSGRKRGSAFATSSETDGEILGGAKNGPEFFETGTRNLNNSFPRLRQHIMTTSSPDLSTSRSTSTTRTAPMNVIVSLRNNWWIIVVDYPVLSILPR